jgi:uncharacterized cupin superfamily protein
MMGGEMVHHINYSVLGGMHKNTELIERAPVDVFSGFHGSTAQYGGYGFPSGGHFSATLHEHSAGSSTTTFLLDHRLQYIVAGEVHVTDGAGNTHLGKAGDLFYLAYGSNVTAFSPKGATSYISIADETPPILPEQLAALKPEAYRNWAIESARTTKVTYFPQVLEKADKVFGDSHLSFNAIGCWKWNSTQLPSDAWTGRSSSTSKFATWNFCSGVFHLHSGPPAFTSSQYNNHEELDFIIDGEFYAKAADGQKFGVRKGDLVHNPRHMNVQYETPTSGAFLSTSLSPIDDFYPQ